MNDKFGVITVSLIVLLILAIFWVGRDKNRIEKPRVYQTNNITIQFLTQYKDGYMLGKDGTIIPIKDLRFGRFLGKPSFNPEKEVIIINKAYIEKLFE